MQGLAAFKLNVQLSQEYNDKLAKAAGKFRNQLVGTAFEEWKQHTQYVGMLKTRLATAVGALRNRGRKAAFCGGQEAAAVRREHKQKVEHSTRSAAQNLSLNTNLMQLTAIGHDVIKEKTVCPCCTAS